MAERHFRLQRDRNRRLFLLTGLTLFGIWKLNRRGSGERGELLGSASFGKRADVRKLEGSGDLIIGRSGKSGRLLHYSGAAHLLTMAPTRSCKGVGTIIPNLLLLDRSGALRLRLADGSARVIHAADVFLI